MMIRRIAQLVFLISATIFLNGCFDDSRSGPAPVIDAWYQPGAASNHYLVRRDDTIYSIAFAFGLDYRALVTANNLSPPYALTPGQRLIMTHRPPSVETQNVSPILSVRTSPAPVIHEETPIKRASSFASHSALRPVISREPEPHYATHATWHWPVKGRLLQEFSRSPDGHAGISIGGRLGEPVRAAATGTVVYSGDGIRGYGNLIIIKHNDSYLSAYAFNQHNNVIVGEHVRAGSVIARMGQNDAGRTLLYFEIRRNGVPMNPLHYLK